MDFYSLSRRDLQFFCKRNNIPANMTNIAMADALKALEIVEGIDEFVNQSESTRDQSPTSVAKNMPSAARTAARTTRRKTKDETRPSELVTRSCLVTTKSLAGELEQENRNTNVLQDPSVPQSRRRAAVTSVAMNLEATDMKPEPNVSKTPAVRSTRRAQAAASSKKDESVQRVYSTRRSVKLLEESMADLSLKTKESLNVPSKKNDDAESENSPAGSKLQARSDDNSEKTEETEVISVRDLNDSLEKEWDGSVVVDHAPSTTTNIVTCSKESESEEMKNDSESESKDDESGVVVDTNQEAFGSKVSASDNVSKVDSVPTVLLAEESKELESDSDSEESCESNELMDNNSEVAIASDKKKTQTSSPGKEVESDSDEWSDYEISDMEEHSCGSEEVKDSEFEEASFSDKKTPAASSTLADNKKNKENVEEEMVLINNGERKAEAEDKKKKTIDEESLKDVSMRQLMKMLKELGIKKSNNTSA